MPSSETDSLRLLRDLVRRRRPNPLPDLTGPTPATVAEAAGAAVAYRGAVPVTSRHLTVRRALASEMRAFHRNPSGPLAESIAALESADTLVVEVAHQANFLPYGGFFRKIVLGDLLARALREATGRPAVAVFGLLDQDFARRRNSRVAELPDLHARGGVLAIASGVAKDDERALCRVPAPGSAALATWRTLLTNWLRMNLRELQRLAGRSAPREAAFWARLRDLLGTLQACATDCPSLAEFNGRFASAIANDLWGLGVPFYRYSRTQEPFAEDCGWLASRAAEFAESAAACHRRVTAAGLSLDFPPPPPSPPLWLECSCLRKSDRIAFDGGVLRSAACEGCGRVTEVPLPPGGTLVSPKAISRTLLIGRGLRPDLFVSGTGAFGFHLVARGVANDLGVPLCPYVAATGADEFEGVGKRAARLALEAGQAEEARARAALALQPSIVDHWVSAGLAAALRGWRDALSRGFDEPARIEA